MNLRAMWAIYVFEMARTGRTIWQSIVAPVISTSLYFVVDDEPRVRALLSKLNLSRSAIATMWVPVIPAAGTSRLAAWKGSALIGYMTWNPGSPGSETISPERLWPRPSGAAWTRTLCWARWRPRYPSAPRDWWRSTTSRATAHPTATRWPEA